MKYTIELAVRGKGVQLLALTEEGKDQLLDEDLDDIYMDYIEEREFDFWLEQTFLTPDCDRFRLTIKDENGNVVYETTDPKVLNDYTMNEGGDPQVEGWSFSGLLDNYYLTRIQTLKGCFFTGEFELDEPFDESKLYILQSDEINDELLGNDVYSLRALYYQRGEGYDMERDQIELEDEGDSEEQYYDTYLMKVEDGDYWTNLQEE